ncbi:DUF2934 domain-containing protein [Jiella marina]|uniref:DUF2934 domain-containing protein n=1 Tax=Jiella sp. LLJ827 TaxID=2917712 RepID=UPI002101C593|nr:DUF2934 domain-containing protein [Jiella sp. LLJ827]MCQ0990118.1 DUF2934 domain-containing protein [Jiella sp. LLJ827]
MPRIDEAAEIRALAYQIWEREGRPSGREHEHWAEANRIYAELHPQAEDRAEAPVLMRDPGSAERSEVERLRAALWTPEPFAAEFESRESSSRSEPWRRARPVPAPSGGSAPLSSAWRNRA